MSEPWFRFFPSDWLAGTSRLSAGERGVYITLLASIYDEGGDIERDDIRLARACGLPVFGFRRAMESLISLGKITESDGRLSNSRAKIELSEREKMVSSARRGAQLTNEKKLIKTMIDVTPSDTPSDTPSARPSLAIAHATTTTVTEESVTTILPDPKQLSVSEKPTCAKDAKNSSKRQAYPYPTDFLEFWEGYPTDANMAKKTAYEAWARMSLDDRKAAIEALPAFRGYCSTNPTYRPVHANRYLTQRRYEGHLQTARKITARAGVFIRRGSPQWEAWCENWRQSGKGSEPPSHNGGWHFPSAYPPKLEATQ